MDRSTKADFDEIVFVNDPDWQYQHFEGTWGLTECGIEIQATRTASKRPASTKALCVICFEAVYEI